MSATDQEKSPIPDPAIQSATAGAPRDLSGLPLLSLLLLPALAAPEVHGVAMAGGAALVALSAALVLWTGSAPVHAAALLNALAVGGMALAAIAPSPGAGWGPWAAAVLATAVAVGASVGGREDRAGFRRRVATLLAVAGTWVGARAVWERWAGLELLAERVRVAEGLVWKDAILDRLEQGRAYAGLVTPAAAGIFLVMSVCATVALAVTSGRRGRAAFLAAAAAIQLAGILATRSLTAAGALVCVAAVTAIARAGGQRALRLAGGVALAAAVLAVGILSRGEAAWSWTHPDSPWSQRAGNVRIALEITRDAPWLGVGPGGYAEAYPARRRPGDNESRHAHCLPAELTAELGVPVGLAATGAFLWFLLGGLRSSLSAREPVRAGLALGGATFAMHNLADFTAWFPSLLWTALIASGSVRDPEEPGGEREGASGRLAALVLVSAAAVAAALGGLAQDARVAGLDAVAAGDPAEGARRIARAVSLAPWDPDVSVAAASAALDAAMQSSADEAGKTAALAACDRAVRLAPYRGSARSLRARARILAGDVPGAFADLQRAVDLDPLRAESRADLEALRPLLPGRRP